MAVIDGVQVRLGYTRRDGAASERVVHPLGLVVKNQVWYLIAHTDAGQRTFRVSRVRSVERTEEPVQRPEGFDLAAAWRDIVTTLDDQRAPTRVGVRTDPGTADVLGYVFGTRLVERLPGSEVGRRSGRWSGRPGDPGAVHRDDGAPAGRFRRRGSRCCGPRVCGCSWPTSAGPWWPTMAPRGPPDSPRLAPVTAS